MPHSTTVQVPPEGRPVHKGATPVPMGDVEHLASFVGGVALACYGLRHSLGHLALVAGGGALIYHALKGNRPALRGVGEPDGQSGDSQRR